MLRGILRLLIMFLSVFLWVPVFLMVYCVSLAGASWEAATGRDKGPPDWLDWWHNTCTTFWGYELAWKLVPKSERRKGIEALAETDI